MPPAAPGLAGRHVALEPLAEAHAEELWPAASEREVWRYMMFEVAGVEDLRAWIRARLADRDAGTALPYLQRDAATGIAFGATSLFDLDLRHRRVEVGHTWIGATHRRTAANTEAKRLLLAHAFDVLDVRRVQLKCDAQNARSRAAIERLGARFEGVLRAFHVLPDGGRRDVAMFSVLDEEWPAVRARLDGLLARSAERS